MCTVLQNSTSPFIWINIHNTLTYNTKDFYRTVFIAFYRKDNSNPPNECPLTQLSGEGHLKVTAKWGQGQSMKQSIRPKYTYKTLPQHKAIISSVTV